MILQDIAPQIIPVKMRIYFRSSNGCVPQHFLNSPQIGTSFDKMRGEGMTESMRAYGFSYPRFLGKIFNDVKHHDTGNLSATVI